MAKRVYDESNVQGRLVAFIRHIGLTNKEFERQCGMSNATVSNMRVSLAQDKVEKISKVFPQLNVSWLLTGKGFMLNGQEPDNETTCAPIDDIVLLKSEIEFLKRENADLRVHIEELKRDKEMLSRLISSLESTISSLQNSNN